MNTVYDLILHFIVFYPIEKSNCVHISIASMHLFISPQDNTYPRDKKLRVVCMATLYPYLAPLSSKKNF